jgi:hypothetical protein
VAKSKKQRRSSIRHMATDDPLGVLEALERLEEQERQVPPETTSTERETEEEPAER